MFKTIYDSNKNRYHVRYQGSDDKSIKAFYDFIYDLPAHERVFYEYGYWISEENYNKLLDIKSQTKLTPYSYQQEAVDFALSKLSSLMLLPCGAGKSFIIIASYAKAVKKRLVYTPGLVVVKASLKFQWKKEIEKFSHFRAHIIETKSKLCAKEIKNLKKAKTDKEKKELEALVESKFMSQFNEVDLFVANYETLLDEDVRKALHSLKIDFLAADK